MIHNPYNHGFHKFGMSEKNKQRSYDLKEKEKVWKTWDIKDTSPRY